MKEIIKTTGVTVAAMSVLGILLHYVYEDGKNEGKKELALKLIYEETDEGFEETVELFRKARSSVKEK